MANYGPAYGSLAENQAKVREFSVLFSSYRYILHIKNTLFYCSFMKTDNQWDVSITVCYCTYTFFIFSCCHINIRV
jgi:hypothetical protein